MELDAVHCYRALRSRDRRFDGRFFTGVTTTGIYCRPVCPAPAPRRENVRFFPCAAAAEDAGFRPCLRCRPETAPGTPAWQGTSAVVSRGLRLIREGALDGGAVAELATRLGIGERQLRRLFLRHLGTSPLSLARARRLHFARTLLDETDLPMTEIAFAAGFQSIRQFNHALRACFGESPRRLRARRRSPAVVQSDVVTLRLAYRPPLDWDALLRFLAARATPGVEWVDGGIYRRTVEMHGAPGTIEVAKGADGSHLVLRARLGDPAGLIEAVDRVRRIFDLTADPLCIAGDLARGAGPRLRAALKGRPGLRVLGAWDGFELAVRAVLGQQISVAGASTLCGRLVEAFGKPISFGRGLTHLFPTPDALASADIAAIGLPQARANALRALARAVANQTLRLDAARGLDDAIARLCSVPGIGEWTAHYIAMRAFGEPDAFPASDLGLRKALAGEKAPLSAAEVASLAEAWRPWRAYAAMALWNDLSCKDDS
ncbi:MAG TPA: AlkA N-terminal domain-containing protein [Myxococcota bacterium]|nr:AlkA N-terminal domain-containing protein [Myxococcota bacterium]